jgi:hypothetical protein
MRLLLRQGTYRVYTRLMKVHHSGSDDSQVSLGLHPPPFTSAVGLGWGRPCPACEVQCGSA